MLSEPIKDLFDIVQERPKEHYRFRIALSKVMIVEKKMISYHVKRAVFALIACLAAAIWGLFLDRSLFAFFMGIFLVLLIRSIQNIRLYQSIFDNNRRVFAKTFYDYSLYEEELLIWESSEERVQQIRIPLSAIKKIRKIGDVVVMEIGISLYLLDKCILHDNSYFLRICQP